MPLKLWSPLGGSRGRDIFHIHTPPPPCKTPEVMTVLEQFLHTTVCSYRWDFFLLSATRRRTRMSSCWMTRRSSLSMLTPTKPARENLLIRVGLVTWKQCIRVGLVKWKQCIRVGLVTWQQCIRVGLVTWQQCIRIGLVTWKQCIRVGLVTWQQCIRVGLVTWKQCIRVGLVTWKQCIRVGLVTWKQWSHGSSVSG